MLLASVFSAFGARRFAHAQSEGVTLSAAAGFDGYCKDERWIPIRVQVENNGPDLDASVVVSYENFNGGVTTTTAQAQLPTSSRKAFFVYIFADGSLRNFTVSALDGKTVVQKTKLATSCLGNDILLVGVISDSPRAFDGLSDMTPLTGATRSAQLQIADLPERYQAWESLDALVISNADTGALSAAQKQALESWLANGGKLLVTGGTQWQKTTAGLSEFLPVEVNSTRNLADLSSLSAYVEDESPLNAESIVTVGTMREGSQALVEQNGVPIFSQRSVGLGSVYFLAADPSVSPLAGWQGMTTLYEQSLATRPPLPPWAKSSFDSYTINQALGAMKQLSMPPILYICGLLVLYVFVMGPVNFLALRRAKRRELAWLTIPMLVILFSCVFYGSGFFYRGNKPILNRLLIMQAWDDIPQANVKALVGLYSPIRAQYDVTADAQFMPQAFSADNFNNLQTEDDWKLLQEDDSMTAPDVSVEISGMRTLMFNGSLPALPITHTLTIDLSNPSPSVSGTVVNASEFTLRNAVIITPGGWKKLGDLKPGASADVKTIILATGISAPRFYSADPLDILDLDYSKTATDVDAARRYSFLQSVLSNYTYGYISPSNWGVYLMGWMDRSDLPVGVDGRRYDSVDTVLYIHSLTPQLKTDGDTLFLPSGFFAWESSVPTISPYILRDIPDDGFILRFKPAIPVSFQSAQSLKLFLNSSNPGAFKTYAWDFDAETWVQLPKASASGSITISDPDRFVAPNGEARIRVIQDQSIYAEITSTTITMQVTP